MEYEATINARMPAALKRGGGRVLEENGVSPTQIVRRLYSYMEQEGHIPACLMEETPGTQDRFLARRACARRIAGSISLPQGFNVAQERSQRIEDKYGSLL